LRVKDVDLERRQIAIRDGEKGRKTGDGPSGRWRRILPLLSKSGRSCPGPGTRYAGRLSGPPSNGMPGRSREWAWHSLPARVFRRSSTGKHGDTHSMRRAATPSGLARKADIEARRRATRAALFRHAHCSSRAEIARCRSCSHRCFDHHGLHPVPNRRDLPVRSRRTG